MDTLTSFQQSNGSRTQLALRDLLLAQWIMLYS